MTRSCTRLVAIILLAAAPTVAQPDADRITDWLERAEDALERGRDAKALKSLEKILKADPGHLGALDMAVEVADNSGHLEKAVGWAKKLAELRPQDRAARLQLARVLMRRGAHKEARAALEPLLGEVKPAPAKKPAIDFAARALAGRLHVARGEDKAADTLFDSLVNESKRVIVREAHDLVALAHAYAFYDGRSGRRAAEKVLAEAQKKDPDDPRASVALGWLYLRKFYLHGDAVEEFKAALEIRPGLCEAHVGLAQAYEEWRKGQKAGEHRRRARAIDPAHPWLLGEQIVKHLGNMELEKAQTKIDRILERNPAHRRGLTLAAILKLLDGDRKGYESGMKAVLAIDATFGEGYGLVARVLNERRRWDECLEVSREAVKVDAQNPELFDTLARYAFYLGHEDEGKEALRAADKADAFGAVWRKNMWEVARVVKSYYVESKTKHFVHRIHRKDQKIVRPYLEPFAEKSWDLLTKKYEHVPAGLKDDPGRVLVETFRSHGDFAARTHGFSHLGATGVCFGPFIAQDSPAARKAGEFSWARTFHHELAHTITLGISKGRIPRWLTEGLSSYEEVCMEPAWYRPHYRDLFDARANGEIFEVLGFDAGFRGPRIGFAYFQGGLTSAWMAKRFGWKKVLEMVAAYAEDKTTGTIVKEVLGVTPQEFDAGFLEHVDELLKDVRFMPRWSAKKVSEFEETLHQKPGDVDALIGMAAARLQSGATLDAEEYLYKVKKTGSKDPRIDYLRGRAAMVQKRRALARTSYEAALKKGYRNHQMHMELATLLERDGKEEEARAQYELALKTYPMIKNAKSDPRLQLARLAQAAGEVDVAVDWFEEHLTRNYENLEVRKRLVSLYRTREDWKSVKRHLDAMLLVYPMDTKVHQDLGDLALKADDGRTALREFKVALETLAHLPEDDENPATEADARVGLARALIMVDGDEARDDALEQVEQALALVPGHASAQKLKRKLGAKDRGPGDKK